MPLLTQAQQLQLQLQLLSLSKLSFHLPSHSKAPDPQDDVFAKKLVANEPSQAKPSQAKRGPAAAAHPRAVPAHRALHGNALNPDTGKLPNARNSLRAAKVTFGSKEILTESDAQHEDLENLTQASKEPKPRF